MGDVVGFQFKGRGKVEEPREKKEWPPELLAEAANYVDQEFIDAGGDYREDQFSQVYWLDLPHLIEFEKHDREIDEDREFWKWFREYRNQNRISARSKHKSWREKVSSKWDDFHYEERNHNYMTSWWSGWGYSRDTELTQKLALALGAVKSIVDVVNDTGRRTSVHLQSDDTPEQPRSYTNMGGEVFEVVVSPQALLDTSIKQEDGIEVTGGFGLHEASHVQYSASVMDALAKPTPLRPMALAGFLFNILEDLRIEDKTSEKYPGFGGYFNKANAYLWDITKAHAPKEWGPELGDKMNAITASVKWRTDYAETVANSNDDKLKAEYTWFNRWADAYREERKDTRTALIEALRHLAEDDDTKQQMQQQIEQENKDAQSQRPDRLTDQQFGELLKRLTEKLKTKDGKALIEPCPSPGGSVGRRIRPVKLTETQAKQIDRLIREELKEVPLTIQPSETPTEGDKRKVIVTKPEESAVSRSNYRGPGPLVNRLKTAFQFRKIAPEYAERAQRTGYINEDDIWKLVGWDTKVFERKITSEIPNTQVTLLVDLSSSMRTTNPSSYKSRMSTAMDLAVVMLECLRTMKGVTVRVRGHHSVGDAVNIYRIWEPGDPMSRLGLMPVICAGGTPDGYGLDFCATELLENVRPGEDMALIILSDGEPNLAYGGMNGYQHVKKVVDHFSSRRVNIIQIAIASAVSMARQKDMYRHWIAYEGDDKLPTQLTQLLIRMFGGVTQ